VRTGAPRPSPGPSARNLALVDSLNERGLYATFSANGPSVAEDDVVDVLLEVWLRVVHGTASAD
jgi:TetR/AcrR family transcriptional regulator, ethionamide resistance regulator